MVSGRAVPDMCVLDSLANDIDDLDTILRMLNSDSVLGWKREWGREFTRQEIVEALSRLIRDDLVQVFVFIPDGKSLPVLPVLAWSCVVSVVRLGAQRSGQKLRRYLTTYEPHYQPFDKPDELLQVTRVIAPFKTTAGEAGKCFRGQRQAAIASPIENGTCKRIRKVLTAERSVL